MNEGSSLMRSKKQSRKLHARFRIIEYKINNMSKVMNMNKIEVTFPSADPSCQLSGDLTLPLDGGDETKLLPAIVIVAGSGVSYMLAQYY